MIKKLLSFIIIFLLAIGDALAVTPQTSGTVNWEFQENGTTHDAGGFDYGNANMDATLAATSATGSSCVVSSSNYNFVSGDVGNWVYIKSGSNWFPGWYQIAMVASNAATLNSAIGQVIITNTTNNLTNQYPQAYTKNTVAGCGSSTTLSAGTWSVDYSQTTSPYQTDSTLASLTGTTNPSTVTDTGLSFGVNTIGNFINITAGTSWLVQRMEIVSVSAGVATLDRAAGSAATLTGGTYFLGGAMPASEMVTAFLANTAGGPSGGNIMWFKYNATPYSWSVAPAGSGTNCTTTLNCWWVGYNTTHGDILGNVGDPTRPSFSTTAITTLTQNMNMWSTSWLTDTNPGITLGTNSLFYNGYAYDNAPGFGPVSGGTSSGWTIENSELIGGPTTGPGLSNNGGSGRLLHSYIHDSGKGLFITGGTLVAIGNLIESNTGYCFEQTGTAGIFIAINNTCYGNANQLGVGILYGSASNNSYLENNIFAGFATAISGTTTQFQSNQEDYNDFYNNGTNWSLAYPGIHDVTTNPAFTNVTQLNNIGTVTSSGFTLTDTGASFTSAVVGQFLHVINQTGGTGSGHIYLITAQTSTTLTLNISIGTGSAITYFIPINHNFIPTSPVPGFPGQFTGLGPKGYTWMGAVQPQNTGSTSGGSNGYTY